MTLTRVDIVLPVTGEERAVVEYWADAWDIYLQDDGQTVKLIAKGDGKKARDTRDAALGRDLVEGWQEIMRERTESENM